MSEESELGRFGNALTALSAAPPGRVIYISHDWWKVSEDYRAARWRRVEDILNKGEAPTWRSVITAAAAMG